MARLQLNINSQVLKMETQVQVLHPEVGKFEQPYPVLYLLHGLMVDDTAWLRYTMLEEFAKDKKLIVVMPNGDRSYYLKQKNGANYERFLTNELPKIVKNIFHISDESKDTYIAGMSMGGYGALHAGLSHPEIYGKVAGISSVTDIESVYENKTGTLRPYEIQRIFGDENPKQSKKDIFKLTEDLLIDNKNIPEIYIQCGKNDKLIEQNEKYIKQYGDKSFLTYDFEEGGHDFNYWNKSIKKVLEWLPLKTKA